MLRRYRKNSNFKCYILKNSGILKKFDTYSHFFIQKAYTIQEKSAIFASENEKVFRLLSTTDTTEIPNKKIMNTEKRKNGETGYLRNEPKAPRTSLLPEDIESERLRLVEKVRSELEGVSAQDILRECEKSD